VCTQVFNVGSLGEGEARTLELVAYDNDLSHKICSMVSLVLPVCVLQAHGCVKYS